MNFNSKHSHLNNLFAELGCTIAKLSDSSKYNDRFITIADRVIALNEGGKVDKKVLKADVELMLGMLEKEGYYYEREVIEEIKVTKSVSHFSKRLAFLSAIWSHSDGEEKGLIIAVPIVMIGLLTLMLCLPSINWDDGKIIADPMVEVLFYISTGLIWLGLCFIIACGFICGNIGFLYQTIKKVKELNACNT